jgi:hypothetical protein
MKLRLNTAITGIRGIMNDWVYKRFENITLAVKRPKPNLRPPTATQERTRDRFTDASAYANAVFADPARRAVYEAAARAEGRVTVRSLVVADFLNLPKVKEVDLGAFYGRIGDKILINARDDFEVTAVKVQIRSAAGAVIEEGNAVMGDTRWVYTATTAVAPGDTVTIEATAFDRPGNNTALSEPWMAPMA